MIQTIIFGALLIGLCFFGLGVGVFVFGKRAIDFAENQNPDELIFKDHDSDLLVRM